MFEGFWLTGLRNWRKLSEFQVPKCKDCQHTKKLVTSNFSLVQLCNITFLDIFLQSQKIMYKLTTKKFLGKRENILKGSLDSIPLPSPSVKIQIMGREVCLRCKGKTLLDVVNKLLNTKSLLTMPSFVLPLCHKQTFTPII